MDVIKFTSVPSLKLKPYAILNKDGKVLHVQEAGLIRLISQAFRVPYEIVLPEDPEELTYGKKLPDGSWTGVLGLVSRSDVDLAVGHLGLTEDRRLDFNFCFPHTMSDFTFMANKLEPLSDNRAIFYPFSYEVWIKIALCMILVTFSLYFLLKRRRAFLDIFLIVFGSLLENSPDFNIHTLSLRILFCTWQIAVLVITNSYKGILLSFLTFPTMVGIRDISDLSKAAVQNTVKCFAYGNFAGERLNESNIDLWMTIAECLSRNQETGDDFFNATGKKALLTSEFFLKPYEREYFISEVPFFFNLGFIYYSKHFCCPEYLNNLIHHFYATGLIVKYSNDEAFHYQRNVSANYPESESSGNLKKISLSYLSGAFYVLLSGWFLGFITLLAEIAVKKYESSDYRKSKISPRFLNINRRVN